MRKYKSCCFSCSEVNEAAATSCLRCGCPACATADQAAKYRAVYQASGGTVPVSISCLQEPPELSAAAVLVAPIAALLLGFLPENLRSATKRILLGAQ